MAKVELKDICKTYPNGVEAVRGFNLQVEDGEFVVLLGPSGCGKSTTLRMIAGLEAITSGSLRLDGRLANELEPKERDVAMVFQNYALFPHMSVYDNVAFGLRARKTPKEEVRRRVEEVAKKLELTELLRRKPGALSGGQRQRVALGRAIARRPAVFLMDEPLSNLDARLRLTMRRELALLHRELGVTTLYVTHDQTEAMTLGDRICLMEDGEIRQVGLPAELYDHPANRFVAGFLGSPPMNLVEGRLLSEGANLRFVSKELSLQAPPNFEKFAEGSGTFGVRPEDLAVMRPDEVGTVGTMEGVLEVVEELGDSRLLHVRVGPKVWIAKSTERDSFCLGEVLTLCPDPGRCRWFDEAGEGVLKSR